MHVLELTSQPLEVLVGIFEIFSILASVRLRLALPFLDLTEGMVEEHSPWNDGRIDRQAQQNSRADGAFSDGIVLLQRGKIPVADLAEFRVIYLLDGSVRRSGSRVRVAARLIRADNGYVMWTETYDRPFDDILMVQGDIATKVAAALKKNL